jgi:Mrp family chromosome partitioning ATPase
MSAALARAADPTAPLRALAGTSRAGVRLGRLLASRAAFRISGALDVELALAGREGPLSLLVASHAPGEGRSTVALILAAHAALADPARRVLLLDADTTPRPAGGGLAARLGLPPGPGLLDHLHTDLKLADAVAATAMPNLFLLPLGGAPGMRLPAARLDQALREARGLADLVVIDSMACASGREVLIAARAAQNVVMVVRQAGANGDDIAADVAELGRSGATVLGCVLNQYRPMLPWPFRSAAERGLG